MHSLFSRVDNSVVALQISKVIQIRTVSSKKLKVTKVDFSRDDLIGPPDAGSNIRPLIIQSRARETPLQKRYRELRLETAEFNHQFWTKHNNHFKQVKNMPFNHLFLFV